MGEQATCPYTAQGEETLVSLPGGEGQPPQAVKKGCARMVAPFFCGIDTKT